ncbi:hypothetical protein BG015_007701 [Linnemannia schmuckeri]|uniref:Uncharacterized protein n=1 Tax=Linnemannia schmuckeri TaxID=64567 RepID=A0A9P5S0A0_9FUNG|nr:hypothetical protein BG015_007701 [Linnemannia schmuckeri]
MDAYANTTALPTTATAIVTATATTGKASITPTTTTRPNMAGDNKKPMAVSLATINVAILK